MSRNRWRSVKETRIADVAKLAGVSTATVSRVLGSPDQVRPQTYALVMDAVRRSGYTPNSIARNLRTRRTMTVLAVVPNLANPVFAQILRGTDDELTQSGYGIVIGSLDNCRDREARYVDLALSQQFDGVLLMNGRIPESGKRSMQEAGVPIIAVCAMIPAPRVPSVVVQDREGSREAARHLIGLGHRRLGYIAGPVGNVIEIERFLGFLDGIQEAGLSRRDVARWEGRFSFGAGTAAAEAFLRMNRRPTAVFGACDESAIGFIKAVREAGLRVPADVSVVGFDGIEFGDYVQPALTTLQQPLYELGQTGARVILRAMRKELQPDECQVRLPLRFLNRGTTGAAPMRRSPSSGSHSSNFEARNA